MSTPGSERTHERIAQIVGGGRLHGWARLAVVAAVALMIVMAAGWVHATGGTQHAWLHLLYLPVLVAAWGLGPVGGVAAGVAAGLATGPGMPLDVDGGIMQTTTNWVYRLGFFTLIGGVSGGLHQVVRRQLAQTQAERRRFASLVDNAPDIVLACKASGLIGYASPSVTRVLGHPVDSVVGGALVDLVHRDDAKALAQMMQRTAPGPAVELRARHADGSWRHLEMVTNNLLDDADVAAVVCNARDVTERRAVESELIHQLTHDVSTGLPNRDRFTLELTESLEGLERTANASPLAVLLVYLDRFPSIQENLGPDPSEQLITALAHRLSALVRPGDTLARLTTTEFAVLCPRLADPDDAHGVAARLLTAVEEPFLLVDGEVHVSTCVGVAFAGDAGNDPDQLLRDVHTAAYHAARQRLPVATFELAWRDRAAVELGTETALHSALHREEFTLSYQPVIDLGTRRAVGVEALIRWRHPTFGTVPPSDFIPLAEQSGLIVPIGRWVLTTACAQLARWRSELGLDDLTMAVNISARQLDGPELAGDVEHALTVSGMPPEALILELTETAILSNTRRAVEAFTAIKKLGVRLAVDDFGIGYSSLGYLQGLPIDILKIDRLFVSRLGQGREDDAIVSAIIGLARTLGLDTIAEGVEEPMQHEQLVELGCGKAQGFHYARPQPAPATAAFLTAPCPGQAQERSVGPTPA